MEDNNAEQHQVSTKAFYEKVESISMDALPITDPVDHTMVYALPGYVMKKVPIDFINKHLQLILQKDKTDHPSDEEPYPFMYLASTTIA